MAGLEGHRDYVRDLAFTTEGEHLVSADREGDVRQQKLDRPLKGYNGLVRSLALSPDGKWLVPFGRDGKLFIWEFGVGKVRAALDEGVMGILVVAFSPDGKTLATGGIDRNVTLWKFDRLLADHPVG